MTVGQLLESMTSMELSMWLAFLDADREREAEAVERANQERRLIGDEE
jgi:hypothetical protein